MKQPGNTKILEIISAIFILLFVYAALTKLMQHSSFEAVIRQSPLIRSVANPVSWALPVVELVTVTLLFMPSMRKFGLYASFFLMSLFTGYIVYMLLFTPDLPCSCGGVLAAMTWKQHLLFNSFFLLLAMAGIILMKKNKRFIVINRRS